MSRYGHPFVRAERWSGCCCWASAAGSHRKSRNPAGSSSKPLRSAKRTPAAWVLRIRLEESSFLPSRDDRSSSAAIVAGQSHRPMPGADMYADCERPMYERVARLSLYSLRRMLVPLRGATRVTGSSSKLPISFSNLKLPTAFAIFLPSKTSPRSLKCQHGPTKFDRRHRLMELRQRQRRLEFERSCALFASDAVVSGLGRGRVTFGQNVATQAV
jgi:hypothetical protein